MSTPITSTPGVAWEASFDSPDDGDVRDAASHQVAHQGLSNKVQYCYDRIESGLDGIQVGTLTATLITFQRTRQWAPVYLADADQTIDSNTGSNTVIWQTLAANRILTLRQTTAPLPVNGDWFDITVFLSTSNFSVQVRRDNHVDLVCTLGAGAGSAGRVACARVELVGGVWRYVGGGGFGVTLGADA